ncbi:MAG: twin-arginine translocase TatA/TatE family subunit [Actinobacteria bacterium]|nr:twin-arginine translocase TatA/TatE family subunit [Actinomycetota bacterium]
MPNIGPTEIILLLLLALLLFGAKRLPEIGRSLGTGMREFKDSVSNNKPDTTQAQIPAQTPVATTPPAPPAPPVADEPERHSETV